MAEDLGRERGADERRGLDLVVAEALDARGGDRGLVPGDGLVLFLFVLFFGFGVCVCVRERRMARMRRGG